MSVVFHALRVLRTYHKEQQARNQAEKEENTDNHVWQRIRILLEKIVVPK